MKKLNKKGFTLVEILATIALLGVVMLIAVGSFNVIKKKVLERQYKAVVTSLYSAGNKYYNDTGEIAIYVKDLVELGYIEADKNDKFIDPVNGFDMAGNNLFLLMKDNDDKDLFYFDSGETRTYNHDIDSPQSGFQYLDLGYGIKTYAYNEQTNAYNEPIDKNGVLNDSEWTNKNITLKYTHGQLNSQISGGETSLKYFWYSSYNSYKTVETSEELIIDSVSIGNVYEDEYTLVVENEYEETKKVFTKKIHIDKINPEIKTQSLNEEAGVDAGTGVQIFLRDDESGVNYGTFKIYSCDESGNKCIEYTDTMDSNPLNNNNVQLDNLKTGHYIFEIYDNAGNKGESDLVYILQNDDCYATYDGGNQQYVPTDKDFTIGTNVYGADMNFRLNGYTHIGFKYQGTTYKNRHKFTTDQIRKLCTDNNNEIKFTVQYAEDKIIYYVNSPSSYKVGLINHDVTKGSFSNGDETYTQRLNTSNTFVIRSAPEKLPYYKVIGQVNLKFIGWSLSPSNTGADILSPGMEIKEDEFNRLLGEYHRSNNNSTVFEDGTVKLFGVYAKNDIDITFNTNGCGKINGSNSYVITTGKNILINFENINFSPKDKLLKWCTSKNCDGCGNDEYSVTGLHGFSGDTTLYAQCKTETPPAEPNPVTYSMTYDANGGTFNDKNGCNGSKCIKSNISGPTKLISDKPTKDKYVFDYWCTNKNCDSTSKKYTSDFIYRDEKNITFYAHYIERDDGYIPEEEEQTTVSTTNTITYKANGGIFDGDDGCSGDTCKKSYPTGNAKITNAQPKKENYTFDYWGTKEDTCVWPFCNKYKSGEVYNKNQDVTLYAHYEENDEVKIKYEWGNCDSGYRNGGLPSKDNQYVNTEYTISNSKPNCSYHQFLYWVDDKGGTYNPGDKILVYSKDLTLTAHFAPTHYKITYKATNITKLGLGQSVLNNTFSEYVKIGEPHIIYSHSKIAEMLDKDIFDDDYRFEYWNAGNSNIYKPGNKIYLTKDMTLNAVYYKYRYDVYFKSTLHLSIGSGCNNLKVNSGENFSIPTSCQINGTTSGNTTYTHDGTFYISWPLGYINNTYYRGQSYSNPTSDNSDIYLKPNSNSETKEPTKGDDVTIDQNYINPTPLPQTLCTVTYYVDNIQYTTDSVICDNYVTIANFDKTYVENGNVKKYVFKNWICNGVNKSPGDTMKISSDIGCYANKDSEYFDICQWDQDHYGANKMQAANDNLFTYQNTSAGANSSAKCYRSDGTAWDTGKVAYYKICDTSFCAQAGLSGRKAQDINEAFFCNYNIYHCK